MAEVPEFCRPLNVPACPVLVPLVGGIAVYHGGSEPIHGQPGEGSAEALHTAADLFLIIRASLLAAATGRLTLFLPAETAGTAVRNPGAGTMMDTIVAFGSGDQPAVCFDLSADSGSVLSDIFSNLCYFQPLLQTCLNRQSVIICKVFIIHAFLQSGGRTRIVYWKKGKKEP